MTLEDLEQYQNLKREIAALDGRLSREERRAREVVTDSVRGSATEFPYTPYTVKIKGTAVRRIKNVSRVRHLRERRRADAARELAALEEFISNVEDSRMRQIIDLRFIQGMTWRQVAQRVYGSPHYEDAVKKRLYRFLKCPGCPESL